MSGPPAYDSLNRLSQDIEAQSRTTAYAYNNNGNLTGTTDPSGCQPAFAYDAAVSAFNSTNRTARKSIGFLSFALTAGTMRDMLFSLYMIVHVIRKKVEAPCN
ncbi:MAG: RHS repeat protein [Deltaproteobacteria bacterium]|nr:RHS repeat protein [Deltaproteobacteria bacterium]